MSISISYFPILSNHFLSIENSPPAITGVLNQISLNSVKNSRETTIKYCCYTAVVIYYYLIICCLSLVCNVNLLL